jgi:hypothetical protein
MDEKFEIEVQKHLYREELKYRAQKKPKGSYCHWLARSCGSVDDIVAMLRWLGFRIKEVGAEWVETTSGVIVYAGTEGLVARAARCEYGND